LENGTARIIYGIETLITRGAFPVHPAWNFVALLSRAKLTGGA
jgi:hypothetical protein